MDRSAVHCRWPDAGFLARPTALVLSLNKDLDREFVSALRKFKLLCGAWPVYANAPSAGLASQLCMIRALCLYSGRDLSGRFEKRLARHQVSVEIGRRVAYLPRTFQTGLL